MAKVVFLQRQAEEWLGIMYISSMLKSHGHHCSVYVESLERGNIVTKALSEFPDIIAFSCLTSDYYWALEKAREIKKYSSALIILGGTHITLNPDEAVLNPNVDIVCIGEGEYPMCELAGAIHNHKDYSKIRNLWVKKNGTVFRNKLRNLIQNLDTLPYPDRELYSSYLFFQKRGKRSIHLGRGCPHNCSYCHNASKKALFKDIGKYVRWRSMESVLDEIEEIKKACFVKLFHFIDDSFGINRVWLRNFIKELSKNRGKRIALQANMRADMVTEDLCEAFKDYGTRHLRIRIAVECGDEEYRREILRKNISNKTLIRAANLFHKYKIDFITYNMVGLPGETLAQAIETLRLNLELRPQLAICFIYQPYPGTELSNYALKKGFLTHRMLNELGTSKFQGFFHSKSMLYQDDIEKIENIQKVFLITAKHPFLFPITKKIVSSRMRSPFLFRLYNIYVRKILFLRQLKDKY
jgi:anaerobic magnesium-protoporphyrin IX monomethyl ester cyclase